MDSPCIKQTVCKVLKIFQYGKYLVAYVLKCKNVVLYGMSGVAILYVEIYVLYNVYRNIYGLKYIYGLK